MHQRYPPHQNQADPDPAAALRWLKQSAEAGTKYPQLAIPAGVTELPPGQTVG